jgi:hypothetical protein
MNNTSGKNWEDHLGNRGLWQVLETFDAELAAKTQAEGCGCGGKLHRANYQRKPRGGPEWSWRHSFCCGQEGCRRRRTPRSVRFLGRRVYVGFVVVLVSALRHGLKPERVRQIREELGVDTRTLERWRAWWLAAFAAGAFWKAAKARLMPPVIEAALPLSLADRFGMEEVDGLVRLLEFLAPITGR